MRTIDIVASCLLVVSSYANARIDSECLNHLGGGLSDVECYNSLASDLRKHNHDLFLILKKTIPKENKYSRLLSDYMRHVDRSIQYCELARQSMNQWVTKDDTPAMAAHHDYDVRYYMCAYETRRDQERYLSLLSDLYAGK